MSSCTAFCSQLSKYRKKLLGARSAEWRDSLRSEAELEISVDEQAFLEPLLDMALAVIVQNFIFSLVFVNAFGVSWGGDFYEGYSYRICFWEEILVENNTISTREGKRGSNHIYHWDQRNELSCIIRLKSYFFGSAPNLIQVY